MAFLLGFFVGPVIDKVGKVITNTGGMMFGDKERESKFNNIVERLKNLDLAIEEKVIEAHQKKHKDKSIFSKLSTGDDDDDDNNNAGNEDERKGKRKVKGKDDIGKISLSMVTKLKGFGRKMHAKVKTLPSEDIIALSKFEDGENVHANVMDDKMQQSKGERNEYHEEREGCLFFNPCCAFMRDNCEFLGCIEETTREVVVNVDTIGRDFRSNVENIRTTVAGTGISDFADSTKFPDICPMFTSYDKEHHGDIQVFAQDLKVWFYTDKNEGLSKLGRDYHMDLMTFDERLEKIETAYEIKFATDNQRNMNIIKNKLDKIESMLKENKKNWTLTKRYYTNVISVLFVFHIIFHLVVHGKFDVNPFNDLEVLQKFFKQPF